MNKKFKTLLIMLLTVICSVCLAFGLAACGEKKGEEPENPDAGTVTPNPNPNPDPDPDPDEDDGTFKVGKAYAVVIPGGTEWEDNWKDETISLEARNYTITITGDTTDVQVNISNEDLGVDDMLLGANEGDTANFKINEAGEYSLRFLDSDFSGEGKTLSVLIEKYDGEINDEEEVPNLATWWPADVTLGDSAETATKLNLLMVGPGDYTLTVSGGPGLAMATVTVLVGTNSVVLTNNNDGTHSGTITILYETSISIYADTEGLEVHVTLADDNNGGGGGDEEEYPLLVAGTPTEITIPEEGEISYELSLPSSGNYTLTLENAEGVSVWYTYGEEVTVGEEEYFDNGLVIVFKGEANKTFTATIAAPGAGDDDEEGDLSLTKNATGVKMGSDAETATVLTLGSDVTAGNYTVKVSGSVQLSRATVTVIVGESEVTLTLTESGQVGKITITDETFIKIYSDATDEELTVTVSLKVFEEGDLDYDSTPDLEEGTHEVVIPATGSITYYLAVSTGNYIITIDDSDGVTVTCGGEEVTLGESTYFEGYTKITFACEGGKTINVTVTPESAEHEEYVLKVGEPLTIDMNYDKYGWEDTIKLENVPVGQYTITFTFSGTIGSSITFQAGGNPLTFSPVSSALGHKTGTGTLVINSDVLTFSSTAPINQDWDDQPVKMTITITWLDDLEEEEDGDGLKVGEAYTVTIVGSKGTIVSGDVIKLDASVTSGKYTLTIKLTGGDDNWGLANNWTVKAGTNSATFNSDSTSCTVEIDIPEGCTELVFSASLNATYIFELTLTKAD